jgi:uncharacterized membrane protein
MKSMKISLLILTLFITAISQNVMSQEVQENRLKTMFSYTIENIENLDQLEEIQSKLSKLEFVEKVKINYKVEKANKGQIIIYVNEPKRTSEGQKMFESNVLKDNILIGKINLLDLKIENY